jgi:hypothetical protein
MNERKLQLKHGHRDRLVRIGITAIEHSLRFKPSDQAREIIEQRLTALRDNDLKTINRVARESRPTKYTMDDVLLEASAELCRLALTEKYASEQILLNVLIKCWDAGGFLPGYGVGQREMYAEMDWQTENLDSLVRESFKELRGQERLLRNSK